VIVSDHIDSYVKGPKQAALGTRRDVKFQDRTCMRSKGPKPLVAIPCDAKQIDTHVFHAVGEKYIDAVRDFCDCTPLLVPATQRPLDLDEILSWADGLFFTGAISNIEPHHYNGAPPREDVLLDPQRDAITLPLLRTAIESGLPTLCICRGFQELNVVMGGTLHQHVQEVEGRFDHREPKGEPNEVMYAPAHSVRVTEGGLLQEIVGADEIEVNSLHQQGIDQLGKGLVVEAQAEDGTIEAVSMPSASGFLLGVQWHPEWQPDRSPAYRAILEAFAQAVRSGVAAGKSN